MNQEHVDCKALYCIHDKFSKPLQVCKGPLNGRNVDTQNIVRD